MDYNMYGVAMVLVFYFFRGRKWYFLVAQIFVFIYINCFRVSSLEYGYTVFNYKVYIPQQVFAIFALPVIWMYNGNQGFHSKGIKYLFYIFYPVHMLVLFLISIFL
ncbi:hypothetical protein EII29_05220 [Leptotrichia sp. OH3620_COT-345]|nr:hypothetical protein EII29_05220 [Leptotrichia sp. OH3620_COT-345]